MRVFGSIIALMAVIACAESAIAFSPILNVNQWSLERLAEAGIEISEWKPTVGGEDPPSEWVEITFDCSDLPKDQDVIMTAWLTNNDATTLAMRAVRKPDAEGDDKVSLLIATRGEMPKDAHVNIFIWKNKPNGGKAAHGFDIKLTRIAALARLKAATTAAAKRSENE